MKTLLLNPPSFPKLDCGFIKLADTTIAIYEDVWEYTYRLGPRGQVRLDFIQIGPGHRIRFAAYSSSEFARDFQNPSK